MTALDAGRHGAETRVRPALLASGALVGSAVCGGLAARYPVPVGVALALATAVSVLWLVPVRVLPPLALILTLIVPTEVLPLPTLLRGFALGVLPLLAWYLRAPVEERRWDAGSSLGLLALSWLVASFALAPFHTNKGIAWFFTSSLVMLIAFVGARRHFDWRLFRRTYLTATTLLGAYAIVETFVLRANPIYGHLYQSSRSLHQVWAGYRAETLMGHPLVNGTIFAAAVVLAVSELIRGERAGWRSSLRLGVLLAALGATQARGAVVAAAIGTVFVLASERTPRRISVRVTLLLGGAVTALLLGSALQTRDQSREGRASAEVRRALPKKTAEALRGVELLGAGPGQAQAYRLKRQLADTQIALESGYAELTVGLGPLGALIFVGALLYAIIRGLVRGPTAGEACALLTILAALGGYNAFEGHPGFLILIALFVLAIMSGTQHGQSHSSGV